MRFDGKFSEAEDNDEEEANWMDSYSDLITDLLAIFVILFSFAMMNQAIENYNTRTAAEDSIANISVDTSIIPGQEGLLPEQGKALPEHEDIMQENDDIATEQDGIVFEQDSFNHLYESIKSYIDDAGLSEQLSVTKESSDQILLRVAASVFFESGSADINTNAEPLLDKISEILINYQDSIKIVRIEGHTDNRPIKTKKFDSNWELSTSRAVNVLRNLLEITLMEPEKFSAVGYSEYYPIDDNLSDEGRSKNRRVDFFIESVD